MAGSRRLPEGPAPDPAVQRLRIRYAKRGRMRFTSSRDFQRALERAVRLAQLPVAFSGGFHPHPKISYANAAPTGAASEAEYVEISLTRPVDPPSLVAWLDAALPDGLDVLEVVDASDLPGALADRLEASLWEIRFRGVGAGEELRRGVAAFLAAPEHLVTRTMKKGPREIDVRAAVVDLVCRPAGSADAVGEARGDAGGDAGGDAAGDAAGDVVVEAVVRHTTPTVRPEEIWTALRAASGAEVPRPVSTRLRQGPLVDGAVGEVAPR